MFINCSYETVLDPCWSASKETVVPITGEFSDLKVSECIRFVILSILFVIFLIGIVCEIVPYDPNLLQSPDVTCNYIEILFKIANIFIYHIAFPASCNFYLFNGITQFNHITTSSDSERMCVI